MNRNLLASFRCGTVVVQYLKTTILKIHRGPPRRRTFRLTEIVPRVCQRYGGATEWGVRRLGHLARLWRSAISEVEEATNLGENQQAEGRATDEAEAGCPYFAMALENSVGGSITCGYPSRAPTEGLYASVACWNERIALREGI